MHAEVHAQTKMVVAPYSVTGRARTVPDTGRSAAHGCVSFKCDRWNVVGWRGPEAVFEFTILVLHVTYYLSYCDGYFDTHNAFVLTACGQSEAHIDA